MSIQLRRHLFLTGEKRVGKSTLLRKLIAAEQLPFSGFETRPLLIDGERRGFTLHGFVSLPPFENDCIVCVRIAERMSVPVIPAFENSGVRILHQSLLSDAPFLLMDELGKMEAGAPAFRQAVLSALDSRKRILGVLQKGSCFAGPLAARDDVTLLCVTPENRDSLYHELLQSWNA